MNKKILIIIFTVLLSSTLFGCATTKGSSSNNSKNEYEVSKTNDKILIKIRSGKHITFEDNVDCPGEERFCYYLYDRYLESIGYHLILISSGDESGYVFISNFNGTRFNTKAPLLFSPEEKHIMTFEYEDLLDEKNGAFIWGFDVIEPTKEFFFEPKQDETYSFVRWESEESIAFKKSMPADEAYCPKAITMTVKTDLKLVDSNWKFFDDFSKDSVVCGKDYVPLDFVEEVELIPPSKESVIRDGRNLYLKLRSGKHVVLKDYDGCADYMKPCTYSFEHYFEDIGYYLIAVGIHEGPEYALVSNSDGKLIYTLD
ncbi:MAG: hypothetical protein KAR06_11640, partial [Deltaproteobacteria bacterium]|nr:hypothetical protein [Deltaproteobacteria bacterium]